MNYNHVNFTSSSWCISLVSNPRPNCLNPDCLWWSIAHLLPKSVVMSNGAGPSALRIVIPTIAKMVKKTNLQIWIFNSVFWDEEEKNKNEISPHDHDLLECGACEEVPQSIQGGGRHNLRDLHHDSYVQVLYISCKIFRRNSHRLKYTKEEGGGDHPGGKLPDKR